MADGLVLTVGAEGGTTNVTNVTNILEGEGGGIAGPDNTLDGDIVVFHGEEGQQVRDGGMTIAQVIAAASVAPPAQIAQTSFLVSGGAIIWISAYTFRVSAAQYYIGGVYIESIEQEVSLATADVEYNRIDVIAVDNDGIVVAIDGIAAEQPSEPDVDPALQLKLGVVLVTANTTQPENVEISNLWAEQAGSPTEWAWSVVGTGFTLGSTSNPRSGTKCIEGTNVAKNAYALGQLGAGTIDVNVFDTLALYIRSKAVWATNRALKLQWYSNGAAKGTSLKIATGYWSFDSSKVTEYQLIAIPISQFAVPLGTPVNQLRITDTNGAIGFYIDDIELQSGVPSGLSINALTVNQADARYAPLTTYRKVGITIDGGAEVIGIGEEGITSFKGSVQVDFAGVIIGWSIQADAVGSIQIEVVKKAGTQTTPVVPNKTTDKISGAVPITLSNAQAAGVGASGVSAWSTAVAKWDSIGFNVVSDATDIHRVTLWLRIQEN